MSPHCYHNFRDGSALAAKIAAKAARLEAEAKAEAVAAAKSAYADAGKCGFLQSFF